MDLKDSKKPTGAEVASVRFTISLTLTVPVEEGDDAVAYAAFSEQRRLEREVIQVCKKLHGDVDAEVLETEYLNDDGQVVTEPDPRSKGDDDGAEYGDPRDARDERRS